MSSTFIKSIHMHPRRYQEHLVDVGRQQVSEIADYWPRYVKHHRVSPFVQVFPFYLCFISYLEMSWYLPSFTYLSIWLIPISHYLQKLVVMRQITSHHFASSLSVHSEYLSFRLHRPASRTFVQRFPSPASIAQHSVLHPESSLVFSIAFSVVLSLPTSCTMLASSCLVSIPSPPSFPHSSSSFYVVLTFSKVWDSSGSHHYSTVLDSRLYYILGLLKVCPCTFVVFRCFVVKSTRVRITARWGFGPPFEEEEDLLTTWLSSPLLPALAFPSVSTCTPFHVTAHPHSLVTWPSQWHHYLQPFPLALHQAWLNPLFTTFDPPLANMIA